MLTTQELAWLHHQNLNNLKHWAGQPQNVDSWNQKWDSWQAAKKPKNRGWSKGSKYKG